MTREAKIRLECVVCDKPLKDASGGLHFQPMGGTAFQSYGHYGSTVFDPMDGSFIELAICDQCLVKAGGKGQVSAGAQANRIVRVKRKTWSPPKRPAA